jgi:ABC-2 type transport system ATP-binding protein
MLVFGPNERFSKAEAKKQLEYWFERLGIQGWGTRKSKSFLRNGTENSVCVLHKPKLLILMSLFWF